MTKKRPNGSLTLLTQFTNLVDDAIQIGFCVRDDRSLIVPCMSFEGEGAFANPFCPKGIDVFCVFSKIYFVKRVGLTQRVRRHAGLNCPLGALFKVVRMTTMRNQRFLKCE